MAGIYVIGEVTADGHLANISAEVATLGPKFAGWRYRPVHRLGA